MKTLLHLSDLHFGRTDPAVVEAVRQHAQALRPDLVVVSGDLTQRARPHEFRAAREFLDSLPGPRIVVPGNHDVPLYNLFQRFWQPLHKYRRFISDELEPFHADAEVAVAGINTARSLTFKDGRINQAQMARLHQRLDPLPEHVMKIVVTHHPFDLPEGHGKGELVGRARQALAVFRDAGADIVLSGHLHTSHTGGTARHLPMDGYSALCIQAGTATSTRGRGHANSFNVIVIDGANVRIERQEWRAGEGRLATAGVASFVRRGQSWAPSA